jgi:hypothetical protein
LPIPEVKLILNENKDEDSGLKTDSEGDLYEAKEGEHFTEDNVDLLKSIV